MSKPDEMDPKEAKFCVLRACGHSQSDAFRIAWRRTQAKPESVHRMAHLCEDREAAKADGNYTALAAFDRCLATVLAMTSSTLVVSAEKSETDEQLIARLSQGDEHKATMYRVLIGKDSFGTDDEKDD